MPGSEYEEFLKANEGQFQQQPNGQLSNEQLHVLPAMPADMQQRLAPQQSGGFYKPISTPGPERSRPTSLLSFYIPEKPAKVDLRAIKNAAFTAFLEWGL
jgi:hypothetical protein